MTDKTIPRSMSCRLSPRHARLAARGSEPVAADRMSERQLASLVDAAQYEVGLLPAPGARSRHTRGAHAKPTRTSSTSPTPASRRRARACPASVSRLNGCIYCASVHARFAATSFQAQGV